MPVYLIYVLIILALSVAAGLGDKISDGLFGILAMVGLVVIVSALWEPLIKPLIKKWTRN